MSELEVEYLPLANLVPYARNARTHSPEQIDQLIASVREFGWTNPVLIDEAGGIIAGHGRVMAAQQMGMDQVPCIRLSHLSETQRRAYVLADNALALCSSWNDVLLAQELTDLQGMDFKLELLGFDASEIDKLLSQPHPAKSALPKAERVATPEIQICPKCGCQFEPAT